VAKFGTVSKCLLLCATLLVGGCDFIMGHVATYYLEPGPPDVPEGVVVHSDIEFAERANRTLLLDVYLPEQSPAEPMPVVLFLFGGGWDAGNRHQMSRFNLHHYPLQGFAVVTADYRYIYEATFPAQMQDVQSAIRWVRANAQEFGFDTQRIGVIGPSAGGHLAALAGTVNRPGELGYDAAPQQRTDVHAVVDFFGPTDFLQGDAHRQEGADPWNASDSSVSRLLGAPIDTIPEKVAAANPITFIDGSEPPFLILHGEKDALVPVHQSEILHRALQAAGVESELVIVEGGDHGFGGDFYSDMPSLRVQAFFKQHLGLQE
jgi:acetyl esterase/lipase